jgi:hypothetical protein
MQPPSRPAGHIVGWSMLHQNRQRPDSQTPLRSKRGGGAATGQRTGDPSQTWRPERHPPPSTSPFSSSHLLSLQRWTEPTFPKAALFAAIRHCPGGLTENPALLFQVRRASFICTPFLRFRPERRGRTKLRTAASPLCARVLRIRAIRPVRLAFSQFLHPAPPSTQIPF